MLQGYNDNHITGVYIGSKFKRSKKSRAKSRLCHMVE